MAYAGIVYFVSNPNNLPTPSGARIRFVDPQGPAAFAGLQVDDDVVSVGGTAMADAAHAVLAFQKNVGTGGCVKLEVLRGRRQQSNCVVPARRRGPVLEDLRAKADIEAPIIKLEGDVSRTGWYAWRGQKAFADLMREEKVRKQAGKVCVRQVSRQFDDASASCAVLVEDEWPPMAPSQSYVVEVRRIAGGDNNGVGEENHSGVGRTPRPYNTSVGTGDAGTVAAAERSLVGLNQAGIVHVTPAFRNGVEYGFVVQDLSAGSWLSKIGVKANDIIVQINGRAAGPERGLEPIKSVTVDRNGEKVLLR